jgi:hypothetical protein
MSTAEDATTSYQCDIHSVCDDYILWGMSGIYAESNCSPNGQRQTINMFSLLKNLTGRVGHHFILTEDEAIGDDA